MNLDFALTENFVTYYCVAIIAITFFFALKMAWSAVPLNRRLRIAKKELTDVNGALDFVDAFEDYNSHVEEALGLPWTEFVETLLLPEPESGDPIRNTGDVSRYLNDATIIFPNISTGFYQAVPNLLTGIGILGTFLGLAAGVGAASSGLASSNPEEITNALQQLLGGASLAFWTSIVGIVCSILFVFGERSVTRRLHIALVDWVGAIESRLERVTPEGVALQQLEQARRTTTQLERFNTELIFSLEKALDEKIAGRMAPLLEQLVEAVEQLRADRSTDSGRIINDALDRFTAAMQEGAGSQFEEMGSIVGDLNRTLQDSAAGMAQSQQDVRTALDSVLTAVRTSMDENANAMNKTLQESLGNITSAVAAASENMAERMTTSSASAAAEMSDTVGSVTRYLQSAAETLDLSTQRSEQVLSGMTAFVEELNELRGTIESTHRHIESAAGPVVNAAREIREASDRTAETLSTTSNLVGRVDEIVNALRQHQESMASAWTRYQERFEDIDESLAAVFRQIDEGLSGYCEQVKEFANELDKTTSGTIRDLAGATAELSESIEDLIPRLPGSSQ